MAASRGFIPGRTERSGLVTLCAGAFAVACSSPSASSSLGGSGAGTGGQGGAAGSVELGGGGGQNNGGSGTGACPDLNTPPAGCPTKVLPVPTQGAPFLTLSKQADVDALEGYTEIDSMITIASDSSGDITSLEPLHCLQSAPLGISVTSEQLTSLDGLRELTQSAGVSVTYNPVAVLGCGLRKLTTTPTVQIRFDPKITRIELSLLDASVVDVDIESNNTLESIDLSSSIVTLNELFIAQNPLLTSVTGLDGLTTVTHWLNVSDNPKLPLCRAQAIQNQLTQPPQMVTIDGDPAGTCP